MVKYAAGSCSDMESAPVCTIPLSTSTVKVW